jgi:hypothetical protein
VKGNVQFFYSSQCSLPADYGFQRGLRHR